MKLFFESLEDKLAVLFGQTACKIDHPCVFTDNHSIYTGHEYWLKEKTLPVKKVIVKRVLLNIHSLKLRVLEVKGKKVYWIRQAFDEQYWSDYDWKLLDDSTLDQFN